MSNYSVISFDPDTMDRSLMRQAYCLNPPSNTCEFGACPNPDVTGIGQQISIYIASVGFAISLVYSRSLIRPMLYAHLGLLYSLLIASVVSISSNQLTKNDSVFVVATIASPGSIALWILTIWSLWNPARFPNNGSKQNTWEVALLKLLSLGSLIFEISMIYVIFTPLSAITFRQPACWEDFTYWVWAELFWMLPYLMQLVWAFVVIHGSEILHKLIGGSVSRPTTVPTLAEHEWQCWRNDAHQDLVTWTETSLARISRAPIPSQGPAIRSILAAIQLCAFPAYGFLPIRDRLNACVPLFGFALTMIKSSHQLKFGPLHGLFILVSLASLVGHNMKDSTIHSPSFSDILITLVCMTVFWQRIHSPGMRLAKVWIMNLYFILTCCLSFGGTVCAWYFTFRSGLVQAAASPFTLGVYTLPLWHLTWLATSIWSTGNTSTFREIWRATVTRAHILKFGLLILTPHTLWIQASIPVYETMSLSWTFGQIFALVVSSVTIASLLNAARNVKSGVWKAILFSEEIPAAIALHSSGSSSPVPGALPPPVSIQN